MSISNSEILKELHNLSVANRLSIVTNIWEEIKETEELRGVTIKQKELLMERSANYNAKPEMAVDWSILKQEVL